MILYQNDGMHFLTNVFQLQGSVSPKAAFISLPCAVLTALLVAGIYDFELNLLEYFKDSESVLNNNTVWAGFSSLVGFLVVFRTSQAYNRFWEGCTCTHTMGAEWFDCCASLIAFCKVSTADQALVLEFQNTLVRLFSMLFTAALGAVEDSGDTADTSGSVAYSVELIDPEGIDEESLRTIRDTDEKVELIFQWIQQLIVENTKTGVLSVAPPILTRAFQEIASGMKHFHDALKISTVPFPFPYTQTCNSLLLMHWLLVPFVVSQWCRSALWAGIFSFMQVFILWSLNFIATELENPFGTDPNDLDGVDIQHSMDRKLRLLLKGSTMKTPRLRLQNDETQEDLVRRVAEAPETGGSSFVMVWSTLAETEVARPNARRFSSNRGNKGKSGDLRLPSKWKLLEACGSEFSRSDGSPWSRPVSPSFGEARRDADARETNGRAKNISSNNTLMSSLGTWRAKAAEPADFTPVSFAEGPGHGGMGVLGLPRSGCPKCGAVGGDGAGPCAEGRHIETDEDVEALIREVRVTAGVADPDEQRLQGEKDGKNLQGQRVQPQGGNGQMQGGGDPCGGNGQRGWDGAPRPKRLGGAGFRNEDFSRDVDAQLQPDEEEVALRGLRAGLCEWWRPTVWAASDTRA